MRRLGIIVLAMMLLSAASVSVAGTTGKIAGTVTDKETGDPLPGVNVVIEGTSLGAATDADGRYYILLVAPGTYSLTASILGYQTTKTTNVQVRVDLTTTVDFKLSAQVLEMGQEVIVVAERPLIQRDGVTTMSVLTSETVQSVVADDFKDILTLNSGITTSQIRDVAFAEDAATGEGLFYARGSRGNELAFMVDGVYVRDGFSGGLGTEIANSAIEELQLTTGNFNAEYGNAMSGVLSITTQDGGSKTSFRLRGLTDTFFGKRSSEYTFVDRYEQVSDGGVLKAVNWGTNNVEGSIGGPLPGFGDKLKYFLSGEYFETDGNIGVLQNEISRRSSAKLTIAPTKLMKLNLSTNINSEELQIYEHAFAHDGVGPLIGAPPGSPVNNLSGNDRISTRTYQYLLSWTHTLSPKAFYEIKLNRFSRKYFDRVTSNIAEYSQNQIRFNDGEDFIVTGYDPRFFDQEDRVLQAKFDMTYQVNINHNLKAGVDVAKHRVWRNQLLPGGDIFSVFRFDMYTFRPLEAAAYVQDKMEFKDLVINVGVRLDHFSPKDSFEVVSERTKQQPTRQQASDKTTLSPRLGIAHPISDKANLHFSYGHFYQVPEYDKLVYNHQRELNIFRPTYGNPDLKPQKTISFEVGFDQQLTDNLAFTVTGFYKDIENLVASDTYYPLGVTYYINQDFANARGVEFNLRTRRVNHLAAFFSYTLSRAEGNSSNPLDTRADLLARPPRVPIKELITLDWDRPHVFNFNVDLRYNKGEGPRIAGATWFENFGVNLTGRFQSGLPYSPTDTRGQRIADENSARMPSTWQLDLRANKTFDIGQLKFDVFTEITNLTNRRNIVNVFTDSGLPLDSRDPGYTTFGERDPYNLGLQRNIRVGAEVTF
jgi:outer membrane receptor protein involved in Fe transport